MSRRLAALTCTLVLALGILLAPVLPAPGHLGPTATAQASTCPGTAGQRLSATPPTHPRTVSLTFDDGPSAFTPQILDVLNARGVRGVFFVTGANVQRHPELARRIVREGHVIANHTWSHPQAVAGSNPYGRFDSLPEATQVDQVQRTSDIIRSVTGVDACFFRGPGGAHAGTTTARVTARRGLTIAHWTVSTEDWAQPSSTTPDSTDRIASRALTSHAHPIVLMHDGKASPEPESQVTSNRSNTVAALGRIVETYRARGHVFTDPAGRALPTTVVPPVDRSRVQAHVAALCVDLLKRPADPSGLRTWTDLAVAHGGDTAGVVRGITTSTEFRNRKIGDAYRLALGRPADPAGLAAWRTSLERGRVVLEDLPVELLSSEESYRRSGATDAGFVRSMYRTVLGREADAAGERHWVGIAQSRGRRAAVSELWSSYEATAYRVDGIYREFLARPLDAAGRRTWTVKAQQLGDDWVRDQVLRSAEYVARARTR